jgi:hypothetical protein
VVVGILRPRGEEMFGAKQPRSGDLVRVRSAQEILKTLDDDATLEGIPFMPEMLEYVDRRFTVSKRVEKICWYTAESSSRRLPNTVLLEDLRCDGTGHGGCQAECRIYWKDAWIERVRPEDPESRSDPEALAALRQLVTAGTRGVKSFEKGPEEVFRCQITESLDASTPLHPREWGQYVAELRSGNVGIVRFLRVFVRMLFYRYSHRLGRYPDMPRFAGANRIDGEKLGLEAGDVVEVRSLQEIGATLDDDARHRGLRYSEEMTPACGKRFRVKNRVDRLIDENTGRMIELKNDCIVLQGFVCRGDRSPSSLFCPREAYPLFREAWLKRVGDGTSVAPPHAASADRHGAA